MAVHAYQEKTVDDLEANEKPIHMKLKKGEKMDD
jgi:hypothetical protein